MLILSKSVDVNRLLALLLSKYIYKNKTKIDLFSTCKFMYGLMYDVLYYEKVSVDAINNNKILNSLTDVHLFSPQIKSNIFDNVISMKITRVFSESTIINFLPPRLKKLEIINDDIEINTDFPHSLTYLKLIGAIDIKLIFKKLLFGLKCLILDSRYKYHWGRSYSDEKKIKHNIYELPSPLPSTIEHFGFYTDNMINMDAIKKNIPTSIKCLEFKDNKFFDILHDYPTLAKIKYVIVNENILFDTVKKIPNSVTSVTYSEINNHPDQSIYDNTYVLVSNISQYVTALSIHNYSDFVHKIIPSTVIKLKMYSFSTNQFLPITVQELQIKNITVYNRKLLLIGPNVKKLTISLNDKKSLDPNIPPTCKILYKY